MSLQCLLIRRLWHPLCLCPVVLSWQINSQRIHSKSRWMLPVRSRLHGNKWPCWGRWEIMPQHGNDWKVIYSHSKMYLFISFSVFKLVTKLWTIISGFKLHLRLMRSKAYAMLLFQILFHIWDWYVKKWNVFWGVLSHLNVSDYKRNLNTRERINKKKTMQLSNDDFNYQRKAKPINCLLQKLLSGIYHNCLWDLYIVEKEFWSLYACFISARPP